MKVLIVKASSLGDILHCFPILKDIRRHYPDAVIDWVVEKSFADMVAASGMVSQVLRLQSGAWRRGLLHSSVRGEVFDFVRALRATPYDLVFDLQGNIKSGLVTALSRGTEKIGFGRHSVAEWPNLLATGHRYDPPSGNIREEYAYVVRKHLGWPVTHDINETCPLVLSDSQQQLFTRVLHSLPPEDLVVVCPGARWPNKQLSVAGWTPWLQKIQASQGCYFLFLSGNPDERQMCETLKTKGDLAGVVLDKMPLPVVQHIMSRASFVLAMDSLPLHLAATAGVPTFSVFGASSMQKYRPLGTHGGFQGSCPYGRSFDKRCPILRRCPTGLCIRGIEPDSLFDHFLAWRASWPQPKSHSRSV